MVTHRPMLNMRPSGLAAHVTRRMLSGVNKMDVWKQTVLGVSAIVCAEVTYQDWPRNNGKVRH